MGANLSANLNVFPTSTASLCVLPLRDPQRVVPQELPEGTCRWAGR